MNNAHSLSIIACLPLTGLLLGLATVVVGRFVRNHAVMRAGLWILLASGMAGLGNRLTGHEAVESTLFAEDLFTMTLPSAIVGGFVSGCALILDHRGRRIIRLAAVAIAIAIAFTATGAAGSLVWAAWSHSRVLAS